ncbi:MAG: O-antigen ligase family protein [Rhodospirillales bacterium]|nr:O-antigen ligase family protein [Rhodospirillales bacterium]
MAALPFFSIAKDKWFSRGLGVALAFMPLLALLAPRALVFAPGLTGLIAALCYPYVFGKTVPLHRPAFGAVLAVILVAAASSLWAESADDALVRAAKLAAILLPGALLFSVVRAVPFETIRTVSRFFPLAWLATAAFLSIEMLANFPLYHLLHGMPYAESVNPSRLNRSTVSITFLLFAAFLPFAMREENKTNTLLLSALIVGIPFLLLTKSQSAQLSFLVAALFLLLPAFLYRWKISWFLLAAGLSLYMLAFPWLAMAAFDGLGPAVDANPLLGRGGAYGGERLEIWDFISRHIMGSPFYGYGIEATRDITFDTAQLYYQGTSVLHPHSFVLQLWIEFGLIGVVAAIIGLCGLLRAMYTRLSPEQNRVALPVLMMILAAASVSYGLWQGWWLGLFILCAACAMLGVRLKEGKKP